MTTLRIQTISGLASRMRGILAAADYAERNGYDLVVYWPWEDKSETLGCFPCWFSELWESPFSENRMPRPDLSWRKHPEHSLMVRTDSPEAFTPFARPLGEQMARLTPTAEVQREIDAISLDGPVVGIHVRHSLAQPGSSKPEWYFERMRNIQRLKPDVRFFLGCDAKAISDRFHAEFPDIIEQEKTYRYDRLGIIRTAAALYLFQRCQWFIGAYQSSYSELIGWVRGGAYLRGWGRPGWMPGGRYEDEHTPATDAEILRALE